MHRIGFAEYNRQYRRHIEGEKRVSKIAKIDCEGKNQEEIETLILDWDIRFTQCEVYIDVTNEKIRNLFCDYIKQTFFNDLELNAELNSLIRDILSNQEAEQVLLINYENAKASVFSRIFSKQKLEQIRIESSAISDLLRVNRQKLRGEVKNILDAAMQYCIQSELIIERLRQAPAQMGFIYPENSAWFLESHLFEQPKTADELFDYILKKTKLVTIGLINDDAQRYEFKEYYFKYLNEAKLRIEEALTLVKGTKTRT
jgi:hypothetical protein